MEAIIPEIDLTGIIAESREVAQALNEFADNLERIEKKYAEPQAENPLSCLNCKWYPDNGITKSFSDVCKLCSDFGEYEPIQTEESCKNCEYEGKNELEKPCIIHKKNCPLYKKKEDKV